MDIDYPKGCVSMTTSCRYRRNSLIGAIAQLQTLVYQRMLIPRLSGALFAYAKFILQPHDSIDPTYLVMTEPESVGFITFNLDQDILCNENIILSTYAPMSTSIPVSLSFRTSYQTSPGIFGMLGSTVGLADSTSIRVSSISKSNFTFMCQEDQCVDEEVIHSNVETAFFLVIGERLKSAVVSPDWLTCGIYFSPELSYPPSIIPSSLPTFNPTTSPTTIPTCLPTYLPSASPSLLPTVKPTMSPTFRPSLSPSSVPTCLPTYLPSAYPSLLPTVNPTMSPTFRPSLSPSSVPTFFPTLGPSKFPSSQPTTSQPSIIPTLLPTLHPTSIPSVLPTIDPTSISPTLFPSCNPTLQPSRLPTPLPSFLPSTFPTVLPTREDRIEYYNSVDVKQLLKLSPISGPLQFSFTVEKYSDFRTASLQWTSFINNFLQTPFNVVYIAVDLWSVSILPGDSYLNEIHTSCRGSLNVNSLLGQITSQSPSEYHMNCSQSSDVNGLWKSNFGKLCRGCTSLKSDCSTIDGKTILLPNNANCYRKNHTFEGKLASVLVIQTKIKNKDSLPQISSIEITPSKSACTATIFLSTPSQLSGNLFCSAFPSSSDQPILKSTVKKFGQRAILGGFSSISLNFTELLPSSSYDMYCFTEDLYGNSLSVADFLLTKKSFKTLCCIDISITGPKYLLYSAIDVARSNKFRMNLQVLPRTIFNSELLVKAEVLKDGQISNNILIHPALFQFSLMKSHLGLSRSFLIVPLNHTCCNITYTLRLMISGDENSLYTPVSSYLFTVVSSNEALTVISPPSLISAIFDPTGKYVDVCFDSNTDRGGSMFVLNNSLLWSCNRLLSFPGDNYTTCHWVSNMCLQIHFCQNKLCDPISHQMRLLLPGDNIVLREQSIRSSCEFVEDNSDCVSSNYSPSHSVGVTPPKLPAAFSPIIKILQHPGGECGSDLIMEITSTLGNGGRKWNLVKWTVGINDTLSDRKNELSILQNFLTEYQSSNQLLIIPISLLFPSHLTFSLELINYLGVRGVGSIDLFVDTSIHSGLVVPSQYSLKLEGSSSRLVNRFEYFEVSAFLSVPPCYTNHEVILNYDWRIYKDSVYQPQVKSISINPSVLMLPPYTLDSGAEYSIYAFANITDKNTNMILNSSMTIQVDVGTAYVRIKGGRRRHVIRGPVQQIDATLSTYIDDSGKTSPIDLHWSCLITHVSTTTASGYGESCDDLFLTNMLKVTSLQMVSLDTSSMIPYFEYTITASSGMNYDEVIFSVFELSSADMPATEVMIDTNFKKFISTKFLNLDGIISLSSISNEHKNNYSLVLQWEVFDPLGEFIETSSFAVTPQSRTIDIRNNETMIYFPLSLKHPDILISGNSYNFKLSSQLLSPEQHLSDLSFAEITLKANGPPTSGLLQIEPPEGISFVTKFLFNALYFIDDEEDYPLSYTFKYSMYPINENNFQNYPSVYLSPHLFDPQITSLLPAGLVLFKFQLTASVIVSDFYSASIEKFCPATVFNHSNNSHLNVFDAIKAAKSQLNLNSLFQFVNNLGAISQDTSCRFSPNCTALNRLPCFSVPDTCGPCVPGYSGAIGDDNTACYKRSGHLKRSSTESCTHDSDCHPGYCKSGRCAKKEKSCPINPQNGEICSGHGKCALRDGVTGALTFITDGESLNCTITDTNCHPVCICMESYYGYRCSLTAEEYSEYNVLKENMCDTLSFLTAHLDDSEEKLQLLVSSLSTTVGIETIDISTLISHCLPVLEAITNITDAGFLSLNNFPYPHRSIFRILSKFSRTISTQGAASQNLTSYDPIRASVSSLVKSMSRSLIGGERPMDLSTEEWRLTVQKAPIDNYQKLQYAPPFNELESAYHLPRPSVQFSENGLSSCFSQDHAFTHPKDKYFTISLVEWGTNPIVFDSHNVSFVSASRTLRLSVTGPSLTTNYSYNPDDYYQLTLRWASEQNFDLTKLHAACPTIVGGSLSKDDDCPCKVVTIASDRVTYSCNDIHTLCPKAVDNTNELHLLSSTSDYPFYHSLSRRRLDFDYDASADDDDQKQTDEIKEYIATLKSIDDELSTTLSNTEFPISEVLPLLASLSVFIFLSACGALLFSYWDEYDNQLLETGNSLSLPPDRKMNLSGKKSFDLGLVFMGTSFVKEKEAVALNHLRHMNSFQDEKGKVPSHLVNQVSAGDRLKPSYRLDGYFANVDDLEYDGPNTGNSYDEVVPASSSSLNSFSSSFRNNNFSESFDEQKEIEQKERREKRMQHDKMISLSARLKLSETAAATDSSSESSEDSSSIHSISTFRSDILPTPKMKNRSPRSPAMSPPPPAFTKPPLERSTSSSTAMTMTTGSKLGPFVRPVPLIRKLSSIGTVDSIVSATGVKIFEIGSQLSSFFDRALPPTSLLSEKNGWRRFLQAILREHDWLRIISYSSRRLPRLIRYFVVVTNLLILFFVDSLFYGIFYPGNEICERYSGSDENTCLSVPSKLLAHETQCTWNEITFKCEMKPPPSSLEFYMIVSIIVTCMSILPQVLCATVLEDICACTPILNKDWENDQDDQADKDHKILKKRSSTLGKTIRKYDIFNNNLALSEIIDVYNYYEHLSHEEETNMILTSVDHVLQSTLEKISLPWRVEYIMEDLPVQIDALTEYLGIYPDGSPVPLTLLQKLFYGSTRKRIEWKINKVRNQSKEIIRNLMRFKGGEEDCVDTALIQYFILEQLSPFDRYALRKEFFRFDNALPAEINYSIWLSGWVFIVCIWLFLVYYIFQWALVHSFLTITAWSFQIMFVLIQDIFVNQLLQIFLIHVVIIEALRPKLREIYYTLNDIVVNKIQVKKSKKEKEEKFHFVRVCQHLSACCRAARVESLKYLPSSQLLMRIDDHDIALCRGKGRGIKIGWLMSVLIIIPTLLALTDDTIQESVLDIALPTTWSCFLLANTYLYRVSPVALVLPYIFLLFALLYRYLIVLPNRRAVQNSSEKSIASLSLFDQGTILVRNLWMKVVQMFNQEKRKMVQWRNMNLSLKLREPHVSPHVSPTKQELKRLGSNLSEVLHEASVRSSTSFRKLSLPQQILNPQQHHSIRLNIPPQIIQMRNVQRQQKFIFRLEKGTNWRSRLINYLFWNLDSTDLSHQHSIESISEVDPPSTKTEEITTDSLNCISWRKSENCDTETKEWSYHQCGTADTNNVEEEPFDEYESEVFSSVKSSKSAQSSKDSWGGLYFDHYYDVDDSTVTA